LAYADGFFLVIVRARGENGKNRAAIQNAANAGAESQYLNAGINGCA
jgi:hypothetical protein